MLVQSMPSLRTTSGSAADISTSCEEESALDVLTAVILPPRSDHLPGSVMTEVPSVGDRFPDEFGWQRCREAQQHLRRAERGYTRIGFLSVSALCLRT